MHISLQKLLQLLPNGKQRFQKLSAMYMSRYGTAPQVAISAPGRMELIGNHTDHNNGQVAAAAVESATLMLAGKHTDNTAHISKLFSCSFQKEFLSSGNQPTEKLMRGIIQGLQKQGYTPIPYCGIMDSQVAIGSGLSSSAACAITLVGAHMALQDQTITTLAAAQVAQYAENAYMGKPCGLMDQLASAAGGIIHIDFQNIQNPIIRPLAVNTTEWLYKLVLVNTGSNHENLTDHYAAIPNEMCKVAHALNTGTLSETTKTQLIQNIAHVRKTCSDRAVLRALHFFEEQERVSRFAQYALDNKADSLIQLMEESGLSSWTLLQNITVGADEQPIALALALTHEFLKRHKAKGACRVHGGGFAGTILAAVPEPLLPHYTEELSNTFESVEALNIRQAGLSYTCL